MERKINVSIKDERIIRKNHVPTPPTPEGVWEDKGRDHAFFQRNVPLSAQLGGVSASAGCPTIDAEAARQAAEQRYYLSSRIHPKQIFENNNTKKIS